MYAGHFAAALALKTAQPRAPTWALLGPTAGGGSSAYLSLCAARCISSVRDVIGPTVAERSQRVWSCCCSMS
jgi:hypothetical protein